MISDINVVSGENTGKFTVITLRPLTPRCKNPALGERFFLTATAFQYCRQMPTRRDSSISFSRSYDSWNFVRERSVPSHRNKMPAVRHDRRAAEAWEPSVTDGLDRFRSRSTSPRVARLLLARTISSYSFQWTAVTRSARLKEPKNFIIDSLTAISGSLISEKKKKTLNWS